MSYVGIGNRQDYIADFPTQSFNGDGSTTTFTLNFEAVTASIRVAVDNVLQPADGSSYYVDGNSLTFSSAPASGTSNISVVYLGTVRQISTVSDNSIANSKIQYPLTESGATVSTFDRTTSDGDIVELQKDGTTVGSIGASTGHLIIGSDDTGLQFNSGDRVSPWNISTNSARDNAINLGETFARFKDLYLSGNIYLGGTGSANALDDYEEGTWTPTYNGASGGTNVGYYVKVGDIVTCYGHRWAFTSTAVSAEISNFPFTSKSGVYISGTVGANTWTNNGASMWGYGSSGVYIYDCVNKQEATAIAGNPKYFSFSITYQTA